MTDSYSTLCVDLVNGAPAITLPDGTVVAPSRDCKLVDRITEKHALRVQELLAELLGYSKAAGREESKES